MYVIAVYKYSGDVTWISCMTTVVLHIFDLKQQIHLSLSVDIHRLQHILLRDSACRFGNFFKVFFELKVNICICTFKIKRRLAGFDEKNALNASFSSIQRSCWWPMLIIGLL